MCTYIITLLESRLQRVELSVCVVEPARLQVHMECGEGLQSDEKVQDTSRVAVVCPVVELGHLSGRIYELLVSELNRLLVLGTEGPHWLREVSVYLLVVRVQCVALVVRYDPWEHGVLVKIVISPTSYRVYLHQVLKVRDLPAHPFVREARGDKQFVWRPEVLNNSV